MSHLESLQPLYTTPPPSPHEAKPLDIIICGHGGVIHSTSAIVHAHNQTGHGQHQESDGEGGHVTDSSVEVSKHYAITKKTVS